MLIKILSEFTRFFKLPTVVKNRVGLNTILRGAYNRMNFLQVDGLVTGRGVGLLLMGEGP